MKMKKVLVLWTTVLIFSITGCQGNEQDVESEEVLQEDIVEDVVEEEVDNSNVAILADTVLTESQQNLTGIWEAEDGCLLAIRERNHDADEDDYFEMDVLLYSTRISEELAEEYGGGMWMKITREDGSSFVDEEGVCQIVDEHMCPDSEGNYDLATYEVTYDAENDCLMLTYDNPTLMDLGTFYRTDMEISEADWEYYYEFNPDREP